MLVAGLDESGVAEAAAIVCTVTGHVEVGGVGGHTEYTIETLVGDKRVEAQHRFSDFVKLHESLVAGPLSLILPAAFPVSKRISATTIPSKFVSGDIKEQRVAQVCRHVACGL